MGFSGFSASLFVVGMILVLSGGGYGEPAEEDGGRFITWSDITWERGWPLQDVKYRDNTTKIIIVDKNGEGDSDTVQGAVDMVPAYNKERVKIHIRPGIYRSVKKNFLHQLFFSFFHFPEKKTRNGFVFQPCRPKDTFNKN